MAAYTLSSTHAAILEQLEEMRRERESGERIGYNDSRRYELPIVESRTAGSDCSYQSGSAVSHPRGMSS